jgi:hypothetical protein
MLFPVIYCKAVPYPERIQWDASPKVFITSLYQGVLDRQPENQAVVDAWATNITSNISTRINTFLQFIRSKEYQNSRWAKLKNEYAIYYKKVGTHKNLKRFYVSKNGKDHYVKGKYSFGVAMAIKDYHATFDTASETYKRNNQSINLLDTPVR